MIERYNMLYDDNNSSSNDDSNDNNHARECAGSRFVLWKSTCQVITAKKKFPYSHFIIDARYSHRLSRRRGNNNHNRHGNGTGCDD